MLTRRHWLHIGALLGLAALVACAYAPGLSGPFLFDDFGNLDVIGAYGSPFRWPGILYYLTSGHADPIGRPFSLLTFLLDARSWPADPWPFKRTNLVLHLINTTLVALVVARLQAGLRVRHSRFSASLATPVLAAGFWGAHPFFVSTTLYVVQREAMLPLTFTLLAVLAWDVAVRRFDTCRTRAGWCWAVLGVGSCTLLATLSKANGLLAPLLVGIAHVCCLRPAEPAIARRSDQAAWIVLGIPSLLIVAYLVHVAISFWPVAEIAGRDWSMRERLLSEPRALWSYVGRLLLPRAGGGGLFVEDFPVSRSWMAPATTLLAALGLLASLVAAVGWRRRYPVLCFAWLFFLGGHLLESTVVPLELYFEHRNYLPAAFLGWPLAHGLLDGAHYRRYRTTFAGLLFGIFLVLSWQRAGVWGSADLMSTLAAAHENDSPRAQVDAATSDLRRGAVAAGLERLEAAQAAHPESIDVAISSIGMHCEAINRLPPGVLDQARDTLGSATTWNYALYDWLRNSMHERRLIGCRGFGLTGTEALLDAAERNQRSKVVSRRRDLWHLRGQLALAQGKPELALAWFDAALAASRAPEPDYALTQAAELGQAGAPELGVRHLDAFTHAFERRPWYPVRDMATLHTWLLRHFGYYESEIARLRQQLADDAESSKQ